jgi:hypothetical protein
MCVSNHISYLLSYLFLYLKFFLKTSNISTLLLKIYHGHIRVEGNCVFRLIRSLLERYDVSEAVWHLL